MPIYEYECNDCKHCFEILTTSSKTTTPVTCPQCASTEVAKTMSASSIRVGSTASSMPAGCGGGCPSNSGFS